jgi:peptidyl-prolyl cis-trans isomerase SurA
VNEFRDGNLLFEIMQKQVWDKASADTSGLKRYFEAHIRNYFWKRSAEAIIFNAGNQPSAEKVRQYLLQDGPRNWRSMVDSLGGQVQADSGRFEIKQLPGNGEMAGEYLTPIVSNKDKTVQFAYVIREHPDAEQRTFDDARGLVINDYQNELENKWIDKLKKKYPVHVDERVLRSLPR